MNQGKSASGATSTPKNKSNSIVSNTINGFKEVHQTTIMEENETLVGPSEKKN